MLRFLLVFVLIPMALVGCGKTSEEKAKDGNAKISRMNEINSAVIRNYSVILASNSTASTTTVQSMNEDALDQLSVTEMKALQPLVQEFRQLASDVLGILDEGKVTYAGSRSDIERAAMNADNVLRAIARKLSKAA